MSLLKQINNGEDFLFEAQSGKITALFLNCTLKKSNIPSNTRALIDKIVELMPSVETEVVTVADYQVDFGVSHEKESDKDEWPIIYEKMKKADIVVMCTPIWFGVRSSILQLVIERMLGSYSDGDEQTGQYPMYGKVGGIIVTGNEDGAHDVIANTMGNMSHLGFVMPPQCDCYWVGDAGAGPSYIEAGKKHLYTNKNAEFMAYNLPFYAELVKNNPNKINLDELKKKAEKISDTLPDYKNHADQKEDAEKQASNKTERERQENDNS